MTTRRVLLLAVLVVGAVALWRAGEPAHPPGSYRAALPEDAPTVQWPRGLVRQYHLVLGGEASVPVAGGAVLAGVTALDADLELRGYGEHDGLTVLGLRLTRLGEAKLVLFGSPALQDRAALEAALVGPEALLFLLPSGDVQRLAVPREGNVFASLVQTIVGEVQWPLRAGPRWTLLEATARGRAETRFERGAVTLTKQRVRYPLLNGLGAALASPELNARATLTLSPEHQLVAADTAEDLAGLTADGRRATSRLSLKVTARGTTTFSPAALPRAEQTLALDEKQAPADAQQQLLSQRIAGLSAEELFDGVAQLGASGVLPDLGAFVARASGLLLSRPELCARLAEHASQPGLSAREREFSLELLAAAGSPEAQAAMRAILSSDEVADPQRRQRFLRLSLLKRPTIETVRFVDDEWRRAAGQDQQTLALVLGSVAGELARTEPQLAQASLTELAHALERASGGRDQQHLLAALGNAGSEAHVDDVLRWVNHPDPDLRWAALDALRATPTPAARAAMLRATTDANARVAEYAVGRLGEWQPTVAEREAIVAAMRSGRLPWRAAHTVVTALAPYVSEPQVRALFEWLRGQAAVDPSVWRRIDSLLSGGMLR